MSDRCSICGQGLPTHQCPLCHEWVCDDCWDWKDDLCVECVEAVEVVVNRDFAQVRELGERVQEESNAARYTWSVMKECCRYHAHGTCSHNFIEPCEYGRCPILLKRGLE